MRFRWGAARDENDAVPAPEGAGTAIGFGARVRGLIEGQVDMRIDGALTGEARVRTIDIGPRAVVDATLKAYAVDISGKVRGRIEAFTVNVARTATVDAMIVHHELNIENGAVVRGARPWRPAADMARRCEEWAPGGGPPARARARKPRVSVMTAIVPAERPRRIG